MNLIKLSVSYTSLAKIFGLSVKNKNILTKIKSVINVED